MSLNSYQQATGKRVDIRKLNGADEYKLWNDDVNVYMWKNGAGCDPNTVTQTSTISTEYFKKHDNFKGEYKNLTTVTAITTPSTTRNSLQNVSSGL